MNNELLHIDLFSGIGGFAIATEEVWPDIEHIFCDYDKFCQQVLRHHWPESEVFSDIREITADTFNKRSERFKQKESARQSGQLDRTRQNEKPRPFILTGGFPCQPFSAAGLRRGTSDDRYLWPEMLRVIQLTKPEWVIAENVGGLVTWNEGLVLETVCTDLEAAGYEVQPFIIPAVAVNAPHRRDRIWFVACHAEYNGLDGTENIEGNNERGNGNSQRQVEICQSERANSIRANATNSRRSIGRAWRTESPYWQTQKRSTPTEEDKRFRRSSWDKNWLEVATQFCSVDDGLPVELDGFKLSKSQSRKEQLKAYGNAIVPQVAIEIMRAIAETIATY